jgi:hypothetical protein
MIICLSFDTARCTTARICAASPTTIATERVRISHEHKAAEQARSFDILSGFGEPSAQVSEGQINQEETSIFKNEKCEDQGRGRKDKESEEQKKLYTT